MTLRIAGITHESVVDGPGLRTVVFTQGCPHHCPGCHNPETHDPNGGKEMSLEEIYTEICTKGILSTGITFSGGEPFMQAEELFELICHLDDTFCKTTMAYTGFTFEQIAQQDDTPMFHFLSQLDYLVDGPYMESERALDLPYRGSRNQRVINVPETLRTGKIVVPDWEHI